MAASKQAQAENLSVKQIAERTGLSEKHVRATLRKRFTRSIEMKNARWGNAENGYVVGEDATAYFLARKQTTTDAS